MKKLLLLVKSIIILIISCPNSPQVSVESELKVLWKAPTKLIDIPNAELLILNNREIIYSGEEELLTSLSVVDGRLIWRSEQNDGLALRADHLLYSEQHDRIYGRHYNNVMIWNGISGILEYELSDSLNGISASRIGSNTLTEDGYAILGEKKDVHILDWDGNLKHNIDVPWVSRSVTYGGTKFILGQRNTVNGGLTQGRIRAFNAVTGDSLWTYQTENNGFQAKIYYDDGVIYGGTRGNSPNSEVVALDAQTGQVIWKYISQNAGEWTNNFLVTKETIFIKGTSSFFALDRNTGIKKWNFGWENSSSIGLMYLEGFVYMTDSYHLYVLEEHTGELVHTEIVPKENGYYWHIAASKDKIFAQTSASIIAYEPWHLRGDQ